MTTKSRYIFISDPHACLEELKELLQKVQYDKDQDQLVLVGDFINRGKFSCETIQYVRNLVDNGAWACRGNHEEHFLRWYKGHQDQYWLKTRPHYAQFSDEDITFINNLPLYIKIPELNLWVVHAGVKPGLTLEHQRKEDLLYLRFTDDERNTIPLKDVLTKSAQVEPRFWTEFGPYLANVIYGHAVWVDGPRIDKFDNGTMCIGIDTGCVFGNALSALIITDSIANYEIVQVKAKQVYYTNKFN